MALNQAQLAKDLKKIFDSKPPTALLSAQKMAQAYYTYAQNAQAGGTVPVFTGLEVTKLQNTIFAAISNPLTGNPVLLASAWSTGLTSFFLLPPVPFLGGPQAGAVTAFPGQAVLIAALTAVFSNKKNSAQQAANGMASALDVATKLTVVTVSPPVGTVLLLV